MRDYNCVKQKELSSQNRHKTKTLRSTLCASHFALQYFAIPVHSVIKLYLSIPHKAILL